MAVQKSNGTTVPHATDYADLLAKLKTFATANGWTALEDSTDKLVLQGSGLGGTDEINVAVKKYSNATADSYGWYVQGYSGYQSGYAFNDQPGHIPTTWQVSVPLWNDVIPYWFIVSGRRIIVIAKVSTTYQMAYLGFYLPFASPNQYPYPLAVGGAHIDSAVSTPRWSGTTTQSSNFWTALVTGFNRGSLQTRLSGGAWFGSINTSSTVSQNSSGLYPYNQPDIGLMRQAIDGSPVLTPIEIHENVTSPVLDVGRLGELDGVFHISGFSQSAEDVVSISGEDYVVVPNVFRSGASDYCAVKLV